VTGGLFACDRRTAAHEFHSARSMRSSALWICRRMQVLCLRTIIGSLREAQSAIASLATRQDRLETQQPP